MTTKIIKTTVFLLIMLLALLTLVLFILRGSLPRLEGEQSVSGLRQAVVVERDAMGMARLQGQDRNDLATALGFVHAQERYFQMDLLRRRSAGELSALFGARALDMDKAARVHRLRSRAKIIVSELPRYQRQLLAAYTSGVNQGMAGLQNKPFEYYLLGSEPLPWRMEDSILAGFTMYFSLQNIKKNQEIQVGFLKEVLTSEQFKFLVPEHSSWHTQLLDVPKDEQQAIPAPPLSPGERHVDVAAIMDESALPGSNGWAIGGSKYTGEGALLANDMHLRIRLPNTWFRASLILTGKRSYSVTGVTLPGVPLVVAGMNDDIAWGFTNAYADWYDWIIVETQNGGSQYRVSSTDWQEIAVIHEVIEIKNEAPLTLPVRETRWGPLIGRDHKGRELAYRWMAHDRRAVNLGLFDLEFARSTRQALDMMGANIGVPGQNIMIADKRGHIAWTIAGPIIQRTTPPHRWPVLWQEVDNKGRYLPTAEYPRVMDPDNHTIVTANARVSPNRYYHLLGDGGYALGPRTRQIMDTLATQATVDIEDTKALQLDTKAHFMSRWQALLLQQLEQLQQSSGDLTDRTSRLKAIVENWQNRADVDAIDYALVKRFRKQVIEALVAEHVQPLVSQFADFDYFKATRFYERPLWRVINARDARWLPRAYASWPAFFQAMITATLAVEDGNDPLLTSWGERNTLNLGHPFADNSAVLAAFLNPDSVPLPGDRYMPRVQAGKLGASMRFIMTPGEPQQSRYNMPMGQSGHPLSPYYLKDHKAWVEGHYHPVHIQAVEYTLTLQPVGSTQ